MSVTGAPWTSRRTPFTEIALAAIALGEDEAALAGFDFVVFLK